MKKILVVEGRRPIEGLAGALFKRRECVLEVASSGAEALDQADREAPDLVIYDATLADFSAKDFAQALHSSETTAETPVIVVLPSESPSSEESALLRAGASAVVFEPADEVDLNVKICELLGISLRRHLRTFVKMKVDATIGASTCFATISDISLGGVFVETDRKLPLGEFIKLQFFLPGHDDAITVIARIVRESSSDAKGYGCQFVDLSDEHRERIHAFVTEQEGDD